MKTLKDAKDAGAAEVGRSLMRGYVTRKPRDDGDIQLHEGKGSRAGLVWYAAPNWQSTRFCYRVYLRPSAKWAEQGIPHASVAV